MNRDKARFLLSGVSSDGLEGLIQSDPEIREALEFVENDPELRSWFEEALRFDRIVSGKIAEVAPPPGLRDSILAGVLVSHPPQAKGQRVFVIAVAALLMVGLFLAAFLNSGEFDLTRGDKVTFVDFEAEMLEAISGLDSLDHRSPDPKEIRAWLQERGIDSTPEFASQDRARSYGTAQSDGEHKFVGCKILDWRGYRVSLICLRRGEDGGGKPDLHLITVPAEAIRGLGPDELIAHLPGTGDSTPQWSTAMWRSGESVHLVVAEGNYSDPRRLVPLG